MFGDRQYNPVQQKTQQFKVSIRKQYKEKLFSQKRKLMIEHLIETEQHQNEIGEGSEQNEWKNKTLVDLTISLLNNKDILSCLTSIHNISFQDQPFLYYNSQGGTPAQDLIEQYCQQLVGILLQHVIPQFANFYQKGDTKVRTACISIILNFAADIYCPNHLILEPFIEYIDKVYDSLQTWGKDAQIIEVGWTLGNLMRKNLFTPNNQKVIQRLLKWIQQLIEIEDECMLYNIYKGLSHFWENLDKYYQRENSLIIPQIYITSRINILQQTIIRNLDSHFQPKIIQTTLSYVKQNIELFILTTTEETFLCCLDNCIKLLNFQSEKVQKTNTKLMQAIIKYYGQGNCDQMPNATDQIISNGCMQNYDELKHLMVRYNRKVNMARSNLLTYSLKPLLQAINSMPLKIKQILGIYLQNFLKTVEMSDNIEMHHVIMKLVHFGLEDSLRQLIKTKDDYCVDSAFHIFKIVQSYDHEICQNLEEEIEKNSRNQGKIGDLARLCLDSVDYAKKSSYL